MLNMIQDSCKKDNTSCSNNKTDVYKSNVLNASDPINKSK